MQILAVREDAQQDHGTDDRVEHLRVIEGLIGIRHRLHVDPFAGGRVVLHLDGQIAANRFHEHLILDRDVRVRSGALHVPVRPLPGELHRLGEFAFVVEAVAHVFKAAVTARQPLEGLEIILTTADAHLHVHVRSDQHELRENRVPIEPEQAAEVVEEHGLAQHIGHRQRMEMIFLIQAEQGKHIREIGRLLQAELDVVTE